MLGHGTRSDGNSEKAAHVGRKTGLFKANSKFASATSVDLDIYI